MSAPRLYLVTPPAIEPAAFAPLLAAAFDAADVAALRLRLPGAPADAYARALEAILKPAQARGVAVIVDAEPALAREWGCDGAHVPAADVAASRATLGSGLSLGAGCGGSYHAAMEAAEAGADYVWFDARAAEREDVVGWAEAMVVPCVVGGGIDASNAADWAATGAEFLALGRAAWEAPDPAAALRRIAATLG